MCGRMEAQLELSDIRLPIEIRWLIERWEPRYNLAPGQAVLSAFIDASGELAPRTAAVGLPAHWGFAPAWARRGAHRTVINARLEEAADKPYFRTAMRYGRALIFASAYFEWQAADGPGDKRPFRITGDGPMAFAGLVTPDEQLGYRAAVLTRPAFASVASIHHRAPVIVPESLQLPWLTEQPHKQTLSRLRDGLLAYAPKLDATAITTRINNPQHDTRDAIAPKA